MARCRPRIAPDAAARHARGPSSRRAALGAHAAATHHVAPSRVPACAEVVAAGVAIADAEGLAALSMRKVAKPSRESAQCRSTPTCPAALSWSS